MKETVCVTGGSGGIGRALLAELVDLYRVKVLFRTKSEISDEWERRGCIPVWGDLGDEAALSTLVAGTRFVFHCAAVVTRAPYEVARAVNVEGTRRLIEAAARHRCQRFIHVSSVAVYSGTPTETDYTEDLQLRDHDDMPAYARSKLQAEHVVKEAARASGLEFVIVRPTCVYGPNTKSYTELPIDLIRKGLPVILGDGSGLMDAAYVDDVAKAIVLAATTPHAAGEVFNIGHETVTLNEFYAPLSKMLHRPARHLSLAAVRTLLQLLRFIPATAEIGKGGKFLVWVAANTKRFPHSKAARVLGYAPNTSLRIGMLQTELWAKRRGSAQRSDSSLEGYGTLPFRPLSVVHPETEEELAEIARLAAKAGLTARAIGSLHSLCPIPETDGVCIVLDKYDKLLNVDGSLVTVQAGMKLRALNSALAGFGLALPVSGSIVEQTVSGAVSTATHGGSIHHGSLSDYLEAVRLIRADGSIVTLDRSEDLFFGAPVSMGLLGVFSTLTFRCVPAFTLRSQSCVKKMPEVLSEFEDLHRRNLYTDMLYFPITDDVEILVVNSGDAEAMDTSGKHTNGRPMPAATADARLVRHGPNRFVQQLRISALRTAATLLIKANALQRAFTRLSIGSAYQARVGRSDWVLAFADVGASARSPAVLQDMEVAVPADQAVAAISVLRDHFRRNQTYPLLPVHIRCSARSKLWLSPSYDRDVCWLELWQYRRSDTLFNEIHELLKPFGYRFHWGKETRADRDYISQQYERWDDFVRLRAEWDPQGVFFNRYLESFFGPASESAVRAAAARAVPVSAPR